MEFQMRKCSVAATLHVLKGGKGSFLNRSEEIFFRGKPYANFQIILMYDI